MSETPSPAPDRLTALIDEIESALRPARTGFAAFAALRAEAASMQRYEAVVRRLLKWDDQSRAQTAPDDTLFEIIRAARATTPEGNHAK